MNLFKKKVVSSRDCNRIYRDMPSACLGNGLIYSATSQSDIPAFRRLYGFVMNIQVHSDFYSVYRSFLLILQEMGINNDCMRKIYILATCCVVCLSAGAAGHRFKSVRGQKSMKKTFRTEAAAPVWRPVSQTDYMHDGEDWMKLGEISFKYDQRGNCTEELLDEEGWLSKTSTAYDGFNLPLTVLQTESEDGETWENSDKLTYVYDPKIHDFFTERTGYDWTEGEWVKNYRCEANSITRNDDGNVIEVVKSLPLGENLIPAYKSIWNYGTDGNANEYFYYVTMDGNEWELNDGLSYKDIVWEKTDGQLTIFGDLLELTEGNNLIKSATVYYNDEPDGHYLVEYSKDLPGFFIKETTNDINEIGRTVCMETLDANGSLRLTTTEYFDEEGTILAEPTYIDVQEAMMDEHGNMTLFNQKETYEGVEELIMSTKYNYTYDGDGNVKEVSSEEYDYESQTYFPLERTVYGEYINVAAGTGVASVEAEGNTVDVYSANGVVIARNLDRQAVSALSPGLYILRSGAKSTKIMVR